MDWRIRKATTPATTLTSPWAADGKASFTWEDKDVNLGSDSHSLFSNGGTALVVHAKADDQKTDPAGNAGDRIACGVVTK